MGGGGYTIYCGRPVYRTDFVHNTPLRSLVIRFNCLNCRYRPYIRPSGLVRRPSPGLTRPRPDLPDLPRFPRRFRSCPSALTRPKAESANKVYRRPVPAALAVLAYAAGRLGRLGSSQHIYYTIGEGKCARFFLFIFCSWDFGFPGGGGIRAVGGRLDRRRNRFGQAPATP